MRELEELKWYQRTGRDHDDPWCPRELTVQGPSFAEGERTVIWPPNKDAGAIHFFRRADNGVRGHDDVPLNELAAIAAPFVRLRMDDESVLRKMAEQFALGRLREATRARFQEAVQIARIPRH